MALEFEVELSGSKRFPYYVISVNENGRLRQIDMMFSSTEKAEDYGTKKGWILKKHDPAPNAATTGNNP